MVDPRGSALHEVDGDDHDREASHPVELGDVESSFPPVSEEWIPATMLAWPNIYAFKVVTCLHCGFSGWHSFGLAAVLAFWLLLAIVGFCVLVLEFIGRDPLSGHTCLPLQLLTVLWRQCT